MNRAAIGKVCLALPGATLDHPFGSDHDAYRVGGKMFVMVGAMGGVSFKVSEIAYEVLTETGRARPAPYLARAKWVNIETPEAAADWTDADMADHFGAAYALVAAKLTRKVRAELGLS